MQLTYTQHGDYLLPNIALADTRSYNIGKYGRMRQTYLKEHRPILYNRLVLAEALLPHLEEIDSTCKDRLERIERAIMQREGVTEALKAAESMEWTRRRNSIHARAEETILAELVYA